MIIPEEELKSNLSFNFAPMIDFLFLMLALFATLAISRATIYDTSIDLVKLSPEVEGPLKLEKDDIHQINLGIAKDGKYNWITEMQSYPMKGLSQIQNELARQHASGVLPSDKSRTEILLHIDKSAPWDRIAKLIFAVRELGFEAHPIYEPPEADSVPSLEEALNPQ